MGYRGSRRLLRALLVFAILLVSAPQLQAMPSVSDGAGQFSILEWLSDSIGSVINAFFTAESGSNFAESVNFSFHIGWIKICSKISLLSGSNFNWVNSFRSESIIR